MYGLLWEVALGATAWSKSCQEVSPSINGGQAHNLCTPQGKSTGALEHEEEALLLLCLQSTPNQPGVGDQR
jgi:hypothetical protein